MDGLKIEIWWRKEGRKEGDGGKRKKERKKKEKAVRIIAVIYIVQYT